MEKVERIKELVKQLNVYRDEYYNKSKPSVSDKEYDDLFDELASLEKQTGLYMSNSPTQTVGYEVKSELQKVVHNHPMLSLDKTKSEAEVAKFIGNKTALAMLKMDGLTISLTYRKGELVAAETRGNGESGENILHNAKVFTNVPLKIDWEDELIVDGEAIIDYDTFERINEVLPENEKYANPRNLASGSVRQLDSSIAAARGIKFVAWKLVKGYDNNSFCIRLEKLKELGFTVVPVAVVSDNIPEEISAVIRDLKRDAELYRYPIDGLVWSYDDVAYGESLGMTGHHIRSQLAFKFKDDVYETKIIGVEFTMGKTGVLTPTAVFEPVDIDGTEVERASVHNISILKELKLGIGDIVTVYKANQIIPQIAENLTKSGTLEIPVVCPVCGAATEIKKDNDTEVLICTNDDCNGKLLGKLAHFASKNAIDIDGLSEATLQFLIDKGWINSFRDLYTNLNNSDVYKVWVKTSGFGKKSVDKLLAAIEKSRNTNLERFLYAQSIPLIGRSASKDISRYCTGSFDEFYDIMITRREECFLQIDGFGETMLTSLKAWVNNHWIDFIDLSKEFKFETHNTDQNNSVSSADLSGKVFVITGTLNHYANRDALVSEIESRGGKVAGSVSAKTSFLINNDVESNSSKNVKAKSLGVPIISENDFVEMINS